jgi:hypothetical protein
MSDDGGLEELFGSRADEAFVEEPGGIVDKPRSRVGWVLRNVALIAVATVVTVAGLRSRGISVSILLVVAAFVSLRLLMFAVSEVAPPAQPRRAASRDASGSDRQWTGTDALRVAVRRWEQLLDWAQNDADRSSRNLLPVLAELADERLRLKHGITRSSDPRRARELLGEPLWGFLDEPGRRRPKAREFTTYVDALERI